MYSYEENHVPLTERIKNRETEILNIISDYYKKHNYSPTIREITRKSSVSSTSTISRYLNRMEEKGMIEWKEKIPRTIKIIECKSSAV